MYYNGRSDDKGFLRNKTRIPQEDYIDIQFMVDGEENMGFFVNHGQATPLESYPERDCYFYANESIDEGQIYCPEGFYAVFFPTDVHRPLLVVKGNKKSVRLL